MPNKPPVKRPAFRSVQAASPVKTPEDLFYKLSRKSTHGYLRGPQQDVLREYALQRVDTPNVAFELPTGTGKTAVGIVVAEWKRTAGQRVAYLSLTNQLAGQVLAEGERLGVPVADLRGTKDTRDHAQEGRFRTCAAVGVTTYSNLFNVNPVIRECDLLVFDDAHGAEHYVSDMWTVLVKRSSEPDLYNSLLADLKPGLSESQLRTILEPSGPAYVELVDAVRHRECLVALSATLDAATADSVKFPWKLLSSRLNACLFLVSAAEIAIRPTIAPTHTHAPFADATQRIYMSATLGGESDLRRAYGIETLEMIRAKSSQWGRRYVFVPGAYVSEERSFELAASLWDEMRTRRAVLLAPSEKAMTKAYKALAAKAVVKPTQLGAENIADTVDPFVTAEDVVLTLAGRYDGLDLPDDQCRLLIMYESPVAINALERHLSERWKLGPVLRRRERTRLIQGMGRCTRNATDFAIIVWLGQSLVNAATSSALLDSMPSVLGGEIRWGVKQSEAASSKPTDLLGMMLGLLDDTDYRQGADADIGNVGAGTGKADLEQYEDLGIHEVRYAKAMWEEDFDRAIEASRKIADGANHEDLAGYRAWWWYLLSTAAALQKSGSVETDALQRSSKCGINAGWVNRILRERGGVGAAVSKGATEPNAQMVWDRLENWGWAGPRFDAHMKKMKEQLRVQYHAAFHEGLDMLGKSLGAETTRLAEPGAPDVVWSFATGEHYAFEAKTGKKPSSELSKKDLQEATGHREWVRERLCAGEPQARIDVIVVSEDATVHEVGKPFTRDLFHITPGRLVQWADRVADALCSLRVEFSGRDFAAARLEFSAALRKKEITTEGVREALKASPLKK